MNTKDQDAARPPSSAASRPQSGGEVLGEPDTRYPYSHAQIDAQIAYFEREQVKAEYEVGRLQHARIKTEHEISYHQELIDHCIAEQKRLRLILWRGDHE